MAIVSGGKILWRRFFSVPKDLKMAYRTLGGKLKYSALKGDPQLKPWIVSGPMEAVNAFDATDSRLSGVNHRCLEPWVAKLNKTNNFEADFNFLIKTQDFSMVVLHLPKTLVAEVAEQYNKPFDGVAAYKLKDKVVLLGHHIDIVNAIKSSNVSHEVGVMFIKKGDSFTPEGALSTTIPSMTKLSALAKQIKCEVFLNELEDAAIIKKGRYTDGDGDFHQYVTIEGDGWNIDISIMQNALWEKIMDLDSEKTGIYNLNAVRNQINSKTPIRLGLIDLQTAMFKVGEKYTVDVDAQIARLKNVTDQIKEHFKRRMINVRLLEGQRVVYVGDIHQNVNNLKLVFDKYEEDIAAGRVILILLGDYVHEAGNYPWSNMSSVTQSYDTLDLLLEKLEAYPGCIIPIRGNHDLGVKSDIDMEKDGVRQFDDFLKVTQYFRGEQYLQALQRFFDALPWAAVAHKHGGPLTLSSHSLSDTVNGIRTIADHVKDMLHIAPTDIMVPASYDVEKTSVGLVSSIMRFVNINESSAEVNPELLLIGRRYLKDPSLIQELFSGVEGLANLVLGHTFLRERDEKDADCYQFLNEGGKSGHILQSYLGNFRVLELSTDGKIEPVWLQNEDQYWALHPQYLEG